MVGAAVVSCGRQSYGDVGRRVTHFLGTKQKKKIKTGNLLHALFTSALRSCSALQNLLVRGVHQFVRENVSLVAVILLLTGLMSRFDPFELVCLLGWMIIGIASSIGFGVGIPTRVLFVWPYILRTSQATGEDLVSAWIQVLPVAVIHALGSALGELPPFLGASLLVRRLNLDHEKTAMAISHRWLVQRMQNGWGWMWVCVLGAWPNVAFDMAGLAAGASGMSLPSFLSAAVVGKAVVRPNRRWTSCGIFAQRVVAPRLDYELGAGARL